jgi:hypothetical protein
MATGWMHVFDTVNTAILRSRWHGLISRDTMLVEFTGKKSGTTFSTPVNYVRQGNTLFFTSRTDRTWWKNLRGGVSVRVWVQGRGLTGHAYVDEEVVPVIASLRVIVEKSPMFRRAFKITQPSPANAELAIAAQNRLVVRVELD